MKSLANNLNLSSKSRRASLISAATPVIVESLEKRMLLSGSVAAPWAGSPLNVAAHLVSVRGHATHPRHDSKPASPHVVRKSPLEHAPQILAHPDFQVEAAGVLASAGSVFGPAITNPTPLAGTLTPSQIQQGYGFDDVLLPNGAVATGAGETIALVDAFHDPNIQSDLHTFDQQYFGGIDPTFDQVNLGSSTNTDSSGGWEFEEALDVEWAHAVAPQATITLVEAASNSFANLLAAVDKAVALGAQVVSMNWSGGEFSGETADDSHFAGGQAAFVASSGDSGAPAAYPAASPNVLAVGGTSLTLDANNNWSSEAGWSYSGGGISAYETRPTMQPTTYSNGAITAIPLTNRGVPDVAYSAGGNSFVSMYDSFPYYQPSSFTGARTGWFGAEGTSCGAPQWSALIALADQGRAQAGLASLGTRDAMSSLYANPGDFHDIVGGTSTGTPNYTAGTGYDLVTGLGTPQAPLVVSSLMGIAPTSAPTAPTGVSAMPGDGQVSLRWNASSGATSWNVYRSSGGSAYALAASVSATTYVDSGLTDGVTYSYEVTATNAVGEGPASTAVSATPQVAPAAPILQSVTASSSSIAINVQWAASSGDATYNVQRATASGGPYVTVASGVSATSYIDTGVAGGTKYYYVVSAVSSAGIQSSNSGEVSATTIPNAPQNLLATAGNAQVTLSWTASFGAASYDLLRSITNGTGYVIVATGITATSFTNTKLLNGKTYYYVVQAVDAGGPSADSNQASATPKHGK
ncbi:MAG TPA: hypothetical protein VFC78_12910 [Tepidisphaeraceae bacterium]|nr:hypothetical protein [Tepidisphaeraceae bacterium]